MATKAVQQHPAPSETFLKVPHRTLRAAKYVSRTTGEAVPLSLTNKVLWLWMKGSHDSYKGKGGTYYESQESIARACGVSEDTVKRAMALFEKHGYLFKTRTRLGNVCDLPYTLELIDGKVTAAPKAASVPEVTAVPTPVAANDDCELGLDLALGPAHPYASPEQMESITYDDPAQEYAVMELEEWQSAYLNDEGEPLPW